MDNERKFRARSIVKHTLARLGFEVRRVRSYEQTQPLGDMRTFLTSLRDRGLRCNVVLDVGANRGDWTRLARSIFPDARFVLIEPQHEMARYLDALCGGDPRCRWFEAGAGAQAGKSELTIWPDLVGSSFLPTPDTHEGLEQRVVPVITIDELLAREGYGAPELLKLDVQGYELEALRGAEGTFASAEIFVLEVSLFEFLPEQPVLSDVVEFMDDRGFVVYDIAGFARRPVDGALGQLDVCFARRDGFLRSSSNW